MPYFTVTAASPAALTNGAAIAGVVPAASNGNFHITQITIGVTNAGGTISDFACLVGLNRATARGTQSATGTVNKSDPNSAPSIITSVDTAYSVQPTLLGTDGWTWPFNSRGTLVVNFQLWEILSNVGTANPLVFVQRSGATMPANHVFNYTIEWLE